MTSSEGGVEYLPLLLATTSLDGTIATTYKMTVVLVVCDNTRAAALNGRGNQFKVKHTRNSEMKLTSAQDALGLVMATADEFDKQYSELVLQKVTPKQWAKYLDTQVPMPEEDYAKRDDGSMVVLNKRAITMAERKRDNLVYLYNHDEKVAPWKGTAFGALQAFNTYEHHEARANKGTVRLERNMLRTIKGEYDSLDRDNYKVLQEVLS
jgi:phage/plasmid-like protein (TIGR03299 family)